jgi:Ulp1 family protease
VINKNHFSLLLIGLPNELERTFVLHLDSLNGSLPDSPEHLQILKRFLLRDHAESHLMSRLQIRSCKVPNQRDLNNCGPFALLFLQRLCWQVHQGNLNGEEDVMKEVETWAVEENLFHEYALQVRSDIISLLTIV